MSLSFKRNFNFKNISICLCSLLSKYTQFVQKDEEQQVDFYLIPNSPINLVQAVHLGSAEFGSSSSSMNSFRVDDEVEILGLKSEASLNGKTAIISALNYGKSSDRILVCLFDGAGQKSLRPANLRKKSFKPANLEADSRKYLKIIYLFE